MTNVKRRQIFSQQAIGPWRAKVSIHAIQANMGRRSSLPHDVLFEVLAEWVGPPAPGFPPSPHPVSAQAAAVFTTHNTARKVALAAIDELRNSRVPDLRKLGAGSAGAITVARALL